MYYTLLMLDRQLQITEGTVEILKKNLETVQAMKDAGIYGQHLLLRGRAALPTLKSWHHCPTYARAYAKPKTPSA